MVVRENPQNGMNDNLAAHLTLEMKYFGVYGDCEGAVVFVIDAHLGIFQFDATASVTSNHLVFGLSKKSGIMHEAEYLTRNF